MKCEMPGEQAPLKEIPEDIGPYWPYVLIGLLPIIALFISIFAIGWALQE